MFNARTLRMGSAALAVSLGTLGAAACDEDDDVVIVPPEQVFEADFVAMNESGVDGTAQVVVNDGVVTAFVQADGMAPEELHPQHIHFSNQCPPATADTNDDGFVDVVEGVPFYGPILVPLDGDLTTQAAGSPDGFPTAAVDGGIDYERSAQLEVMLADLRSADPDPDDAVTKLENDGTLSPSTRTVVLHGVDSDADLPATVQSLGDTPAEVTLPVACGELVETTE